MITAHQLANALRAAAESLDPVGGQRDLPDLDQEQWSMATPLAVPPASAQAAPVQAAPVQAASVQAASVQAAPVQAASVPAAPAAAMFETQAAPTVTKDDVVRAFQALAQNKGPDAVLSILRARGLTRVSEAPETTYPALLAAAQS